MREMKFSELKELMRDSIATALTEHEKKKGLAPGAAPFPFGGGDDPGVNEIARMRGSLVSAEKRFRITVDRVFQSIAAGGGHQDTALKFASKHYAGDAMTEKALSSSDFTAGGALLEVEFAREVIEFLRAESVVMSLNPRVRQMPRGSVEIPKITEGATGTYVGENAPANVTEEEFGNLVLIRKKLNALVPISMDEIRFPTIDVDGTVRDDTIAALQERQDAAFIRDDGTLFTPKGLRFQVPPSNVIAAGANTLTGIEATLGNLELALRDKNIKMRRPGWLMSPRTERRLKTIRTGVTENYAYREEMSRGLLNGFPYRVTTQIPEDLGAGTDTELYFCDFDNVVVGIAQTLVVESGQFAYNEGGTVRSAFSRDQMVIKAQMQHDIGLRHDFTVAISPDVDWVVV